MNVIRIGLFHFSLLFIVCCAFSCKSAKSKQDQRFQINIPLADKQRGMHAFGIRQTNDFEVIKRNNIEWVTIVPWGFQSSFDSPKVFHSRGDSLELANSNRSRLEQLTRIHEAGFKIFLKPHIWMDTPPEGKWRSHIFQENIEDWKTWSESYSDFILRYAKIAEQAEVEMFCVGTELTRLSTEKAEYWRELIKEVRSVYSGKITYAANWYQEFEKLEFWDELDFIGIQAYFPVASKTNPSIKEIKEGWIPHIKTIESIHKKYNKAVVFTEIGYKSTEDSAMKPWEWMDSESGKGKQASNDTQSNCYLAFFEEIWPKPWFAGAHLWQLRTDYEERRSSRDKLDFTPLEKPAEEIIRNNYQRQEKR